MLTLALLRRTDPDPVRGWVAAEHYAMRVGGEAVGTIQLRLGHTDALRLYNGQVGYAVDPAHRGHGYAARALRALLPIAARHGFAELWITCTPHNHASRRTLEQAGADYHGLVDTPPDSDLHRRGDARMCRFRLAVPDDSGM